MLDSVITERPGGLPLGEAYRSERHWVCCRTCRKRHEFYPASPEHCGQTCQDFAARHPESRGCYVYLLAPGRVERLARRVERRRRRLGLAARFAHNASVLVAFQSSDQSLDLTSFNSLASSATAGWSSNYIDNSTNLYLDYVAQVKIAAVNTAPGSDKVFYLFAATGLNTSDLPTTGASSGNTVASSGSTAAALTFPSISTLGQSLPVVWTQPYPVQNVANVSPCFGVAKAFNWQIGLYVWLPVLNFSGMTIAASGNSYKYRGVYNTVA